MKWRKTKNPDLIDQRGGGGGRAGGFPMPTGKAGAGGLGIAGIIIFILIQVLGGGGGGGSGGGFEIPGGFGSQVQAPGAEDPQAIPPKQDPQLELKQFSGYVSEDAQDMWEGIFEQQGAPTSAPSSSSTTAAYHTGCGSATSAVGPFYCPADQSVYLDLFLPADGRPARRTGRLRLGLRDRPRDGPPRPAAAGHERQVRRPSGANTTSANELSVRLELQADCYAGVWAKTVFAEGELEEGDIEEAFGAAGRSATTGCRSRRPARVDPDSFTHGTSEQRAPGSTRHTAPASRRLRHVRPDEV